MASKLAALKNATSLKELAPLLGMPASAIAFTLYKIPQHQKYTIFPIAKKGGGDRLIKAPIDRLKKLQRALADLLTDCRTEFEATSQPKIVSHAFRKEASILTNACQHRRRRYVLNLDLENFFPTLNFGRVRGYFIKNKTFALHEKVATVIAQIACDGVALPQGSPCSPIISDLLAHLLDVRLLQLAKASKCTYSRYADDLTFSTNRPDFPPLLAYHLEVGSSAWVLGDRLLEQIDRAGFSVNHKKTRMQYRGSRQIVTGLTVNEKVNIRADYYRASRLMCSALFATGGFHHPGAQPVAGVVPKGSAPQLEGILSHIHFIKRMEKKRSPVGVPLNSSRKGIEKLYDRFLFYRRFVALERPLVVCEGKTDSIYMDAALRQLPYGGILFDVNGGKKQSRLQFFNYSDTARDVMGMGGGTSNFVTLIHRYEKMVLRFKHAPLLHPVILLVDNDDGATCVFPTVKNTNISHTSNALFYRITRNLYLIKTPEIGATGYSKIEDLFTQATLDTLLDGKKFNPNKKIDPATEYGKIVFAERVVAPNATTIDFSGFAQLFDRIAAVIGDYAALLATGVP